MVRFVEFRTDRNILGGLPHMAQPETQAAWNVVAKAIDGVPLEVDELEVFRRLTGLEHPRHSYRELVIRVGRQAGKSRFVADRAVWKAFTAPRDGSARGTYVAIVAQDSRAAMRTVFNYVLEAIDNCEMLSRCVVARTSTTVTLDNGVTIAVYPCRPQALRGIRCLAVYVDEFAHFRTSDGNPVDTEMLRAIRPTLAMTNGELVILSSPYGMTGEFYNLNKYWGRDSATLVVASSAPGMNSLLPADYIETLKERDPDAYLSEVLGEWRPGLSCLFDPDSIDAVVGKYRERPREPGAAYRAFGDISGGRHDATTLAIGHLEGEHAVCDLVRAWPAPHSPESVIAEAAALATSYGCYEVTADRYGAQLPVALFARSGVRLVPSELDRSRLYLELVPRALSGSITIPNCPALLRELRGLERKRGFAGRDRVDHRPGAHDDRANALAGVVYLLGKPRNVLEQRVGGW